MRNGTRSTLRQKHYPCVAYLGKGDERVIRNLQRALSTLTGSRASLSDWRPHITVGKALELDRRQLANLKRELHSFASGQSRITVRCCGYSFMVNSAVAKLYNCEPYVICLNVIANPKLLSFVKKLNVILEKRHCRYDIFPYRPHLTLAFKDLNREEYRKAKIYLKNRSFSKTLEIKSFSLATDRRGDGRFQEVIKFKLKH